MLMLMVNGSAEDENETYHINDDYDYGDGSSCFSSFFLLSRIIWMSGCVQARREILFVGGIKTKKS